MIAGRYTLDREIGRGGMGAVWLARDEVLGRDVAIKRIGAAPGGTSPDLERAEREARLAARLNHPHVVAVFDLVTEESEQWLVMEYVSGVTLAELVRRDGALTPDEASPLLGQAADALAAAHSAGIVHRDVKPSNMLVTSDGQVKLSDFGIARAEADASLTQTGLVTGSPAYLAPEVASGEQATAASDVWSLGATLYHALDGRPPYEVGDNLMGALYRIVHDDPPRLANAGWLAPLLEKTMTRARDERWSMAQVRDFLHAGPTGTTIHPAPTPVPAPDPTRTEVFAQPVPPVDPQPAPSAAPRRRGPAVPVLVAIAAVLLLGIIIWAVVATRPGPVAQDDPPPGEPTGEKSSEEPSADPSPGEAPTAAGMESFMEDYLATAPSDPETAFRMLTPEFQQASGGIDGYRGFWDTIATADLLAFSADPAALTVSYTVEYRRDGEDAKITDDVSLALVYQEGTYKIAGES